MKRSSEADSYSLFAEIYDHVMDHIDYGHWASFIFDRTERYLQNPKTILDIACGSGTLLRKMQLRHKADYFGLDISPEMIERAGALGLGRMQFQTGDMCRLDYTDNLFELITSTHDSLNYVIQAKDVQRHFVEINRVLTPGGLYWVDVTTEENILRFFHRKTSRFKRGPIHLKWSNKYSLKTKLIESTLKFRNLKTGDAGTETHLQRFYPLDALTNWAEAAGLKLLDRFSDYEDGFSTKGVSLQILLFCKPKADLTIASE